jgi:hypothetical protein
MPPPQGILLDVSDSASLIELLPLPQTGALCFYWCSIPGRHTAVQRHTDCCSARIRTSSAGSRSDSAEHSTSCPPHPNSATPANKNQTQNATQDHDSLLSDLPARQVATKTRAPAKRTFEDTPSKPRSTPAKQVKTHDARRRSTQTSTQTESTAIKTSLELGSITYAGEGWSDELKRAFENRLQQYKDRKGTTDDKIAGCVNKHLARDPPGCLLAELYRTRMVRAGFSINADVTWYKCGHCEGKAK